MMARPTTAATIQKILLPLLVFFENPALFVSNPPARVPCSNSSGSRHAA